MFECVVCAARTNRVVTLWQVDETVPLCSQRCCERFLEDPVVYLGAEMATDELALWSPRS